MLSVLADSGQFETLLAYAAATCAAITWASYSVLNRKWGTKAGASAALPFVLLLSSVVLLAGRYLSGETSNFSNGLILPFGYLCVMPYLANVCWDIGSRRGSITFLSLMADGLPWASLTIAKIYLGILISATTWISAGLIVTSALLSRLALLTATSSGSEESGEEVGLEAG